MDDVKEQANAAGDSSLAKKILVPLGAAVTSAAVTYGIKKAPELVDRHLKPRLGSAPRDLATDVIQRARDLVESHTPVGDSGGDSKRSDGSRRSLSPADRERERTQRTKRRRERRAATAR